MLSPAFTAKWEPTKMRSRIISREKMNQRKMYLVSVIRTGLQVRFHCISFINMRTMIEVERETELGERESRRCSQLPGSK